MILLLTPQICYAPIPHNVSKIYFLEHPMLFGFRPKTSGGTMKFHPFKWQLLRGAGLEFFKSIKNIPKEYIVIDKFLPNALSNVKKWEEEYIHEDFIVYDHDDHDLTKEWKDISSKNNINITILDSPLFITPINDLLSYQGTLKTTSRISQTSFYIWNRQRLNILLENGKPIGGSWTYDTENRKSLPKDVPSPNLPNPTLNQKTKKLKEWCLKHKNYLTPYPQNQNFWLPTTRQTSKKWLNNFIKQRFHLFGSYQDAMRHPLSENGLVYHSGISALLNIGLLKPEEVIEACLKAYEDNKVDIASCEGFIRQIIGWREFVRWIYRWKGEEIRKSNYFNHQQKLTHQWFSGETNILPLDEAIQTAFETGYLHHILRLMVVANLMNLYEIEPHEVYKWFMMFSVDSWDWVMVPNVYSMGLYADNGMITTKVYVSSSNYTMVREGGFPKGNWQEKWDALYWNFIGGNPKAMKAMGRFGPIQFKFWERKSQEEKDKIKEIAKQIIYKKNE